MKVKLQRKKKGKCVENVLNTSLLLAECLTFFSVFQNYWHFSKVCWCMSAVVGNKYMELGNAGIFQENINLNF